MDQIEEIQAKGRRNSTRQWFSIEVLAYVLVCLSLVTVSWAHNNVSGVAMLVAWAIGGCLLTLGLRGIYRQLRRR